VLVATRERLAIVDAATVRSSVAGVFLVDLAYDSGGSAALSPDGRLVAVEQEHHLALYDLSGRGLLRSARDLFAPDQVGSQKARQYCGRPAARGAERGGGTRARPRRGQPARRANGPGVVRPRTRLGYAGGAIMRAAFSPGRVGSKAV
jgi:hypothetical protein